MLHSLSRIVQEVHFTTSIDEALDIIVRRVKDAIGVDVCSVYLKDKRDGHYVLMATDGLASDSVGRIRISPNEGLVGLVGEREEPITLQSASAHPRFRLFPETGEARYNAFLGVPIIHYRRVLGVLVAQQSQERLFDDTQVAFAVTIAAQLAGAIHYALATGALDRLLSGIESGGYLQGTRGSPGVALGTVKLLDPLASFASIPDRPAKDPDLEVKAFRKAVAEVRRELRQARNRLESVLPEEALAVFDVYVLMLRSDELFADTVTRIRAGSWAPAALRDTVRAHARVFDQMENAYLRARGQDIRDIGRRLLDRLHSAMGEPRHYPERCVLVAEDISVGSLAAVPVEHLSGLVCMRGSSLSHTAVLARALGIPAVMGLGRLPLGRLDGRDIIVDGYQGRVYIEPPASIRAEFARLRREEVELATSLRRFRELPAESIDGSKVALYVNTGLLSDIPVSLESGAEGVGLYRSEFDFMARDFFPGEDEQYAVYREVMQSFAPLPVTMRTLDVGGDKALPYLCEEELNPSLGWRGLRVTLDHPEILLVQLRAMLRAGDGLSNLRILFPMVRRVSEVDEALGLLARAYEELRTEGHVLVRPQVGVMVEAPSTIYQFAPLARRVDFISIGTNDLTQYLLAVDRGSARVGHLYDSVHPAVISAVHSVVTKGRQSDKAVSVCGEMAGDPVGALLLLGMGIESLSMAASNIPRIKWVIRSFTRKRAEELLQLALELENPEDVRSLLNEALEEAGLGGLIRAGK
jgi:phosphotransferase system enzyme I (PtsP)